MKHAYFQLALMLMLSIYIVIAMFIANFIAIFVAIFITIIIDIFLDIVDGISIAILTLPRIVMLLIIYHAQCVDNVTKCLYFA